MYAAISSQVFYTHFYRLH